MKVKAIITGCKKNELWIKGFLSLVDLPDENGKDLVLVDADSVLNSFDPKLINLVWYHVREPKSQVALLINKNEEYWKKENDHFKALIKRENVISHEMPGILALFYLKKELFAPFGQTV